MSAEEKLAFFGAAVCVLTRLFFRGTALGSNWSVIAEGSSSSGDGNANDDGVMMLLAGREEVEQPKHSSS